MADFRLLNYSTQGGSGAIRPGILVGEDRIADLHECLPGVAWASSTLTVLNDWDLAVPVLHDLAGRAGVAKIGLSDVKLQPP